VPKHVGLMYVVNGVSQGAYFGCIKYAGWYDKNVTGHLLHSLFL
jgi:hypothetical protein